LYIVCKRRNKEQTWRGLSEKYVSFLSKNTGSEFRGEEDKSEDIKRNGKGV